MYKKSTAKKLVGLFMLFAALLNYPVLEIFSHQGSLGGIPVLAIGIFGFWGLLIGLTGLILARGKVRDNSREL